jgi:RNA polymerase sigma factor (sigma-70 family)
MMSALILAAEDQGADRVLRVVPDPSPTAARPTPDELCSTYSGTVCRFAAMVAASDADADDLAQEALLKAVRSLDRFDPAKGTMDAWLWRIVANVAKDSHRARARRAGLWQRLVGAWSVEPAANVEDRALESITRQELLIAIRRLAERDRMLIALRFGADLDLATVGEAVGLSADSAGQAVLRALGRLRRGLEKLP